MKRVLEFLNLVRENNDREWFNENKKLYQEVQAFFNDFAMRVAEGLARHDHEIAGLQLRDITYRIYRDIRFSKNKDPYKTHMGTYICRGGKKSGFAGYYFHLEADGDGSFSNCFITSGAYMPDPASLRSIRDEIYDNGNYFLSTIKKARGFKVNYDSQLKRLPAGYESGPYDDYMKLRDFYLEKQLNSKYMTSPDLASKVVADFARTTQYVQLMNRAIEFAREEAE